MHIHISARRVERSAKAACILWVRSISEISSCFCGLDPGNLKFETVRTHKRHIRF